MEFIIRKDFTQFFKKNWKLMLEIFLVIICYGFYAKNFYKDSEEIFITTLGLHILEYSTLDIVIFLFHKIVTLYIMISLFFSMLRGGIENLFLRLSMKKWFYYKELSMVGIITILKIGFYIISFFISGYKEFSKVFFYFGVDCLVTLIFGFVPILLLMIFYKNKWFVLPGILLLLGVFFKGNIPLTVVSILKNPIFILVSFFLCIGFGILNGLCIKKIYIDLFEGIEEK